MPCPGVTVRCRPGRCSHTARVIGVKVHRPVLDAHSETTATTLNRQCIGFLFIFFSPSGKKLSGNAQDRSSQVTNQCLHPDSHAPAVGSSEHRELWLQGRQRGSAHLYFCFYFLLTDVYYLFHYFSELSQESLKTKIYFLYLK